MIESNLYIKTKDYFLSGEEFSLYKHPELDYLQTHPAPLDRLMEYYKSEEYISHSDAKNSLIERIYHWSKKYNIAYKFSKLGYENGEKTLLDYGCGTGDFLKYAQKKGLNVYGIEPKPEALKLTQKKIGENCASDLKLTELDQTFDYITLWHVLEHVPDLEGFIEVLKSKIKPEGKILIAVPNHHSFDARFYKKYWAAWDVPRHLSHFSIASFIKFASKHELEVQKIYPLYLDSFYVSLLSEKYMKTNIGFVRAIMVGLISNLKAVFNKNYSSVIYKITKN